MIEQRIKWSLVKWGLPPFYMRHRQVRLLQHAPVLEKPRLSLRHWLPLLPPQLHYDKKNERQKSLCLSDIID